MKTRIIQDDPTRPEPQIPAEARRPANLAAWMGGWSAQHRTIAILGWFAFVIVAFVLGKAVGTTEINEDTSGVGGPPLMTRWNRRSENSHELTSWERQKAGFVTAVRTWKRKHAEALALEDEREQELVRVRRSIEAAQAHAPEAPSPSSQRPPAQPADVPEPEQSAGASQPRPGLSVAEQQAAALGLGGPCWWEDTPERRARHEARRRARYRHV
jgi:hypothetical protein